MSEMREKKRGEKMGEGVVSLDGLLTKGWD